MERYRSSLEANARAARKLSSSEQTQSKFRLVALATIRLLKQPMRILQRNDLRDGADITTVLINVRFRGYGGHCQPLPYENPKLSATAIAAMDGKTFAEALERCIERSKPPPQLNGPTEPEQV